MDASSHHVGLKAFSKIIKQLSGLPSNLHIFDCLLLNVNVADLFAVNPQQANRFAV